MPGSKTSLRRPAKGDAFRAVPEAEDAGSKRHPYDAGGVMSGKTNHHTFPLKDLGYISFVE
jgi:hypothetical protein